MYLTRLIAVPIALFVVDVPIAVSAVRAWRARHGVLGRTLLAVAITVIGMYWATRPGMPGTLRWGDATFWVGDAGTGTGLGDLVCEDLKGATGRRGPLRTVGYVGLITDRNGDPHAEVVQGGLFHGAEVLQPVSQIGDRGVLRDLLIERDGCLVDAVTQI